MKRIFAIAVALVLLLGMVTISASAQENLQDAGLTITGITFKPNNPCI